MDPERPFPVSRARRLLDVLVAVPLLVLAAPLLGLAALAILVTSGRPVLFVQPRTGEGGRPFPFCKLRTMRPGDGSGVTAAGDPRITRVGQLLRRTSIDELPQLWHVLTGEMTLVGPRPEGIALAARYPAHLRLPLLARPGLTGPGQLGFRERAAVPPPGWDVDAWYLAVLVPRRVAADLAYLRRPTLRATLRLVLLTAGVVFGLVHLEQDATAQPEPPVATPTPVPVVSPRTAP